MGVTFPRKKRYVTLEWPLIGHISIEYFAKQHHSLWVTDLGLNLGQYFHHFIPLFSILQQIDTLKRHMKYGISRYFCSLDRHLDLSLIIDTAIAKFAYHLPRILFKIITCILIFLHEHYAFLKLIYTGTSSN